jgi:hypothetical protein
MPSPGESASGPEPERGNADVSPVDESQDLAGDTGDADRGYGVVIQDGEVVQLDPDADRNEA